MRHLGNDKLGSSCYNKVKCISRNAGEARSL
jgi:hypothetical protein